MTEPPRPSTPSETTDLFGERDPGTTIDRATTTGSGSGVSLPERVGRFVVRARLGEGAFGEVYRTHDPQLDREVALKVAKPGALAAEGQVRRFLREARAAANLRHPYIVPLFETGQDGDRYYIASAFIPGGTLAEEMKAGALPFGRAVALVRKLAEALGYAHRQGIVHRDVKPTNVLLDDRGDPLVADFGLAARAEEDEKLTHEGTIMGTPAYMSPEQAAGRSAEVGPASDQYALGVMLFEMLTGRRPFAGAGHALLAAHVGQAPPSLRSLNRAVPRDLETICLKCLEKDPQRRYGSCEDLAEDLRRWQAGEPIQARRIGLAERTWRWAKRNPAGAGFVGVLLAAVVATSALVWLLAVQKQEAVQARIDEARERTRAEEKKTAAEKAEAKAIAEQRRAEEAVKVTAQQRGLALNAVGAVLRSVDNRVRGDALPPGLREGLLRDLLADVDRIRDHAVKNPLADRTEATAHDRLGEIYLQGGRVQDAADSFVRAFRIQRALLDAAPDDPALLASQGAACTRLAEVERRLGHAERARALSAEGLRMQQARLAQLPARTTEVDRIRASLEVSRALSEVATADLFLGEPARAVESYLAAERAYADLPQSAQNLPNVIRIRSEIQARLGDAQSRLGQLDEAEAHFRKALATAEDAQKSGPATATYFQDSIAFARTYLGDFYLRWHDDRARATAEYALALEVAAPRLKAAPNNLFFKGQVATLQYRIGTAAADPEVAKAAYADCLRLREELARIDSTDMHSQMNLALAQARAGRAADADETVDRILKAAGKDPEALFQVACTLGILAGNAADRAADRYRNRAFKVLGELIRNGWKDRGPLQSDPDLAALRKDPRFADVLALKPPPLPLPADQTSATIRVLIPRRSMKTTLKIEGEDRGEGGQDGERVFRTPPLEADKEYTYTIEMFNQPNNYETIIRTREVHFKSGQEVTIDLRVRDDKIPDRVRCRWVPTPGDIVEEMCKLARVGPDDVVLDPGCGDAGILTWAVREARARAARGIDINPKMVETSRKNIEAAGLRDRITVREGDPMEMKADDLKDVTVVALYLGDELNAWLRPILWAHLRPGARVVSHRFLMGDWAPDRSITVKGRDGDDYTLHVWTVTGKEKTGEYPRMK
jgi:uncharacterized protein (TIGR03000 family)